MLAQLLKAASLGLGGYNQGKEQAATNRLARTKAKQDEEDRIARLALLTAQTRKMNEPDVPNVRAVPEHEAYASFYDSQIAAGKTPAQADAIARQRYGKAAPREPGSGNSVSESVTLQRFNRDREIESARGRAKAYAADGHPPDAIRRFLPRFHSGLDEGTIAGIADDAVQGRKKSGSDQRVGGGTTPPRPTSLAASRGQPATPPRQAAPPASRPAPLARTTPEEVSSSNRPPAKAPAAAIGPTGRPVTQSAPIRQEPQNEDAFSDADLWERKKGEGMSPAQATAYVESRKARRR